MQMLDAEAILKTHSPDFYNSLQMECSEGFPGPQKKKAYWTAKVNQEFPHDALILSHTKLDPFSFYAGLKIESSQTKLLLRNYKKLKQAFEGLRKEGVRQNEEKLKFLAECIQSFDELPAHLLLAQSYFGMALASKENLVVARQYASEVIQRLGLAVSVGYGSERYSAYCKYDPSLQLDKNEMLRTLIQEKLITLKQLDKQWCMKNTSWEEIFPEGQETGSCVKLH